MAAGGADPRGAADGGSVGERSDSAVGQLVRVTLQGPSGHHDLVVSPGTRASELVVPVVAALLGDLTRSAPAVLTRSGSVLDPRRAIADQGVRDGDVLVVVPTRTRTRTRARRTVDSVRRRPVAGDHATWLLWCTGAACLLLALGALAAVDDDSGRWVLVLALAGCGLGSVLAPVGARADAARVLLPVGGGLAVLLLEVDDAPGGRLLALTAACVVTAILVAAARATDRGPDEPLLVLLVVSVVAGLLFMAVLLAGGPEVVVWSVAVGLALPVVRLVPGAVVDVPDTVLLELDRLSVTAWSARDQGRGRARMRLRAQDVARTVERGQWLHACAVVGACVLAAVGSVVLVAGHPAAGLAPAGRQVLVAVTALGLALVSRTVRGRVPKVALLLAAGVCASSSAAQVLASGALPDGIGGVAATAALGVLGLLLCLVAAAFGAGWRSVRWARVADGVEGLCVALAAPAALVAAGAVEWFRQLVV